MSPMNGFLKYMQQYNVGKIYPPRALISKRNMKEMISRTRLLPSPTAAV